MSGNPPKRLVNSGRDLKRVVLAEFNFIYVRGAGR
jgi:hypothetical protein